MQALEVVLERLQLLGGVSARNAVGLKRIQPLVGIVVDLGTAAHDIGVWGGNELMQPNLMSRSLTVDRSWNRHGARAAGVDVTQGETQSLEGISAVI